MKKNRVFALLLALTLVILTACGAPAAGSGTGPSSEDPCEAGPDASGPEFETFSGTILEVGENQLLVLADEGSGVRRSADQFWVGTSDAQLADREGQAVGLEQFGWCDRVEVTFGGDGYILETYPAIITAGEVKKLPKTPLTREDVKALAQKGDALDWPDFAPYESAEVGSGLYILALDIDGDYAVMVGGVPREKPRYIRLYRTGTDAFLDLVTADEETIDSFFAGEMFVEAEPEETECTAGGDYPAVFRAEGRVYGLMEPIPAEVVESAIIGYTTSYTDGWPEEDGQTNFSREPGLPYARVADGVVILYENEWWSCQEYKE